MSRSKSRLVALGALLALSFAGAAAAGEIVEVAEGQLRGSVDDGVGSFRGIPYALPPTGERRWRAPEPSAPWDGVRAATEYGARCPQRDRMSENVEHVLDLQGVGWVGRKLVKAMLVFAAPPPILEDCLFLNVMTPNVGAVEKFPVMVWIHGGGHQNGAGSQRPYGSVALVKRGVVQVTLNYRIGPLGFFAHPALSAESPHGVSGNYGVLDQIAALDWVRENIAAFGGDPNNITIFGESAGGHSVGQLMATPFARGTFHKAIAMSGVGTHQFLHLREGTDGLLSAEKAGVGTATRLGVKDAEAATTGVAAALRALTIADLLSTTDGGMGSSAYHPAIDGWLFPKSVAATFAAGEQAAVPLIVGSTSDEGNLFVAIAKARNEGMRLLEDRELLETPAQYAEAVERVFGENAERVRSLYPASTASGVDAALSQLFTDSYFGANARYAAAMQRQLGQPAYLYHFTRTPPGEGAKVGAIHGSDVQFTFGALLPIGPSNDYDAEISDTMGDQLVQFARSGDPNVEGRPRWPLYDATDAHWMQWGDPLRAASVSRTEKYEIFDARRAELVSEGPKD